MVRILRVDGEVVSQERRIVLRAENPKVILCGEPVLLA